MGPTEMQELASTAHVQNSAVQKFWITTRLPVHAKNVCKLALEQLAGPWKHAEKEVFVGLSRTWTEETPQAGATSPIAQRKAVDLISDSGAHFRSLAECLQDKNSVQCQGGTHFGGGEAHESFTADRGCYRAFFET